MACLPCGDIEEFSRAEMFSQDPVGSLDRYDGHMFVLSSKAVAEWPSDALTATAMGKALEKEVKEAMKQLPDAPKMKVIVAATIEGDEDGDVLFFPPSAWGDATKRAVRYKIASEDAVKAFVANVVLKRDIATSEVPYKPLEAKQFFVCSHAQRDKRCGGCGPILVAELTKALDGVPAQVRACSHVGGHIYAGNVLMYTKEMDWYGYVRPSDVPALVKHAAGGADIPGDGLVKLWRGRMGMLPDDVKKAAGTLSA